MLRRVQQDTVGHRGHKDHLLYKLRGLLRHGAEHLSSRQVARVEAALEVGDPDWEVTVAWGCYQRLRSMYHQRTGAAGKHVAADVIAALHTRPILEVARLGRNLRAWRAQFLAYFDTDGVSNGGTEVRRSRPAKRGTETTRRTRPRSWGDRRRRQTVALRDPRDAQRARAPS